MGQVYKAAHASGVVALRQMPERLLSSMLVYFEAWISILQTDLMGVYPDASRVFDSHFRPVGELIIEKFNCCRA